MIILAAACFFSFCAVLTTILLLSVSPERSNLFRRIEALSPGRNAHVQGRERISYKALLRKISQVLAPKGLAARFETDMIKAGIPLKGEEATMLWLLLLLVPSLLVLLLTRDLIGALLVMALGLAVPFFVLKSVSAKRLAKFDQQISGALVILANSMRAGFSFMQALEMVGKEMEDPMAGEVRRVLREMHLGVPTEQALVNMGERIGSKDFDLVITAILIQRSVGGNLAEVLDNISETIRGRIQLAGEVKVLTAQGKISGLVIGLLPVCLCILLYFINKEYILLLFTDPRGLIMVAAALVSQVVGLLLIKRIVDIQL